MYNKVILMGRLTKAPDTRQTQSGKNVTNLSIAVDRRFSGSGEERKADFFNCVAWEKTGDFIAKWFGKGDPILIEGELQNRQYDDSNGVTKYVTEVIVDRACFTGNKNGGGNSPAKETEPQIRNPISNSSQEVPKPLEPPKTSESSDEEYPF